MTTYYSINLDWNESNLQSSKNEICHYIIQILQAGEYKLGSITVRAQLLRDHLRVEVSTNNHDNDLLIQDIFGEFFSIETICKWSTTSKVFLSNWWWCLGQRFNETSSQKRCWTRATWSHLRCTGAPCLRRWAGPAGSEQSPTSTWQGLCTGMSI